MVDAKSFEVVLFWFLNNPFLESYICIIVLFYVSHFLHFYMMYVGY